MKKGQEKPKERRQHAKREAGIERDRERVREGWRRRDVDRKIIQM